MTTLEEEEKKLDGRLIHPSIHRRKRRDTSFSSFYISLGCIIQ